MRLRNSFILVEKVYQRFLFNAVIILEMFQHKLVVRDIDNAIIGRAVRSIQFEKKR